MAGRRARELRAAIRPKSARTRRRIKRNSTRRCTTTRAAQGVIHGDLFRDNVLWDDDGEGGVIDFYFACDDALLYDLAITVNDWCTDALATVDPDRADALLEGYDAHRPLTDLERELWPVMLRRAALRTWLGRLEYNHFPKAAEMTIPKDHGYSRRLLEHHIVHARALDAAGD